MIVTACITPRKPSVGKNTDTEIRTQYLQDAIRTLGQLQAGEDVGPERVACHVARYGCALPLPANGKLHIGAQCCQRLNVGNIDSEMVPVHALDRQKLHAGPLCELQGTLRTLCAIRSGFVGGCPIISFILSCSCN